MNQILNTKISNNRNKLKRNIFKLQLYISIIAISAIIISKILYIKDLKSKEIISNSLSQNFNIYKLYQSRDLNTNTSNTNNIIFGIIEIPTIKIYYPIFANINEENLKIAPCKLFGKTPSENGNICIAGHNYNNSMFFSNLFKLNINDIIYLFDNKGTQYEYKIYDIYEVSETDFSPIYNFERKEKILTLITCNNNNSNRIIVRAKQ